MNTPALEIEQLQFLGLGPFSFSLQKGEIKGIQGPSGIGKSQLLQALVDLIPSQGSVTFQGQSTKQIPAPHLRKQIGYLPATSAWWFDTVGEHFPSPEKINFNSLGFAADILAWEVHRLSTGERQRLAFVRLLHFNPAGKPQILLLDEPTASLDAENQQIMEGLIIAEQKQGTSILLVSHQKEQIQRLCGSTLIMGQDSLEEQFFEETSCR